MASQLLPQLASGTGLQSGVVYAVCNLNVPDRWNLERLSHAEALSDIERCAHLLSKGAEALSGLYLRITDTMRAYQIDDDEARQILSRHFPPPRVSEFLRVAHAPPEVYRRYRGGLVGFRSVLNECRGYRLHDSEWIKQRKIRRAAVRIVKLLGSGQVNVLGHKVIVV